MKSFLQEAFTFLGGTVEVVEHGLSVTLPEEGDGAELAKKLGQSEFELVFEPEHLTEGRELVAPGSHVLRVLDAFLDTRSARSYVVKPADQRLTLKALAKLVKPASGFKLSITDRQASEGHDLFVVYRVRYRSRERVDELMTVRVQTRPGLEPDAPATAVTDLSPPSPDVMSWQSKPRKQASPEVLKAALAHADATAVEQAGQQAALREVDARKGFQKDLSRLHAYYAGQIAEYGRRRKSDLSQLRIEELEEEREIRIRELAAAAEVRVEVEPLQLLTIEVPLQSARLRVVPKPNSVESAEADLPILFDRTLGAAIFPACPACKSDLGGARLAPCEGGHVVHDDCLGRCARCEASPCTACVDQSCKVCEEQVCTSCADPCGGCRELICKEHAGACAVCEANGCESCLKACASCDKAVCADDRVAVAAGTQAVMCITCAKACPGCGTATLAKDLRRCDTCGRRFCSTCNPTDASACTLCSGGEPAEG